MTVRLSSILIFLAIANCAMAQCDSTGLAVRDSAIRAKNEENAALRRMLERRDNEILLERKINFMTDSMHVGFWRDLRFELKEQKQMQDDREKYYLIGNAFILTLVILFGHIR